MTNNHQLALDYAASFTANTASAATATTALAVATTATWVGAPWEVIAIGGAALSIGATAVSRSRAALNRPNRVPLALAGTWALWCAEVVAALALDPFTFTLSHWWAAAALFVTTWALTYWALDTADIADEAHYAETLDQDGATPADTQVIIDALINDRTRQDLATRWATAVNETLGFLPNVAGLTMWDPVGGVRDPGFSILFDLPKGASSQAFTAPTMLQLAENAGLPNGCAITTAKGQRQGQILLHVETVPPAELVHDHPADWSPLSINHPIPLAYTPHGHPITVNMREAGAMIVGPPGTGKTTLLNNILSSMARCNDVLVWGVDTGKAGLAFRHWTTDLPEGTRPLVTEVAATNDEALNLVEHLQREATARVHHYAQWMKDHDTDLVPVGPDCPMIFLVFDESAEIFSDNLKDPVLRKLNSAVTKLMRTSRQAGIRTLFTFVDINASSSMGSTDLDKFSPIKLALTGDGTTANQDAALRWWGRVKGVDMNQLTAKGAGIGNFGQGPQVFRGPRTKPSMVEECTIQTTGYRPDRDLVLTQWVSDRPRSGGIDGPAYKPVEWTATDSRNLMADMAVFEEQFQATDADTGGDAPEGFGWLQAASATIEPDNTDEPEQDPDEPVTGWRRVVLNHLAANPDTTYSTSELVQILATTYGTRLARPTLSTQLTAWANNGTITVHGSGAHRTYSTRENA